MDYYISVGALAVAAILSCFISLPIFKILQLSGYKASGLTAWWKSTHFDTLIRYAALTLMGFVAAIVYVCCFPFDYAKYCAVFVYVIVQGVFAYAMLKKNNASVKLTGRMVRLIICDLVLMTALTAGIAWAVYYSYYCQTLVAALGILSPFVAVAANAIMKPIESLNNLRYVRRAKTKLKAAAPIVVGITGSYGKTTAKNLLRAMLETKYSVLATPGSYNTPMGVCKTVNVSLDDQDVFIAELGARYIGDIKQLCGIVAPKYGIITAIGDMHIATLKNREGVAKVKFELAQSLPTDGMLALNGYNSDCAALFERETACRKTLTGEGCDVRYDNLKIDGNGTTFDLYIGQHKTTVATKLLGMHIAELTCVCAAVAHELGVSLEQIASAVGGAETVEHRLQLVPSAAGIVVIDDAYNSNPVGAKNALDVLACFDGHTKIAITPGFVELGAIEKECNTELGKQIAAVCDRAYLIGSRAADIKAGAVAGGMDECNISLFGSRDEAVEHLKSVDGQKAVLFENDLPDNIK